LDLSGSFLELQRRARVAFSTLLPFILKGVGVLNRFIDLAICSQYTGTRHYCRWKFNRKRGFMEACGSELATRSGL
jgi:hypothetical protein